MIPLLQWLTCLIGLNLQRLGTLINVDLPWNPTRLEQRIGRIKRFELGYFPDTVLKT
ncbi:MAG: helicase-related protein [Cyanobacteria bacterium J06635_1]